MNLSIALIEFTGTELEITYVRNLVVSTKFIYQGRKMRHLKAILLSLILSSLVFMGGCNSGGGGGSAGGGGTAAPVVPAPAVETAAIEPDLNALESVQYTFEDGSLVGSYELTEDTANAEDINYQVYWTVGEEVYQGASLSLDKLRKDEQVIFFANAVKGSSIQSLGTTPFISPGFIDLEFSELEADEDQIYITLGNIGDGNENLFSTQTNFQFTLQFMKTEDSEGNIVELDPEEYTLLSSANEIIEAGSTKRIAFSKDKMLSLYNAREPDSQLSFHFKVQIDGENRINEASKENNDFEGTIALFSGSERFDASIESVLESDENIQITLSNNGLSAIDEGVLLQLDIYNQNSEKIHTRDHVVDSLLRGENQVITLAKNDLSIYALENHIFDLILKDFGIGRDKNPENDSLTSEVLITSVNPPRDLEVLALNYNFGNGQGIVQVKNNSPIEVSSISLGVVSGSNSLLNNSDLTLSAMETREISFTASSEQLSIAGGTSSIGATLSVSGFEETNTENNSKEISFNTPVSDLKILSLFTSQGDIGVQYKVISGLPGQQNILTVMINGEPKVINLPSIEEGNTGYYYYLNADIYNDFSYLDSYYYNLVNITISPLDSSIKMINTQDDSRSLYERIPEYAFDFAINSMNIENGNLTLNYSVDKRRDLTINDGTVEISIEIAGQTKEYNVSQTFLSGSTSGSLQLDLHDEFNLSLDNEYYLNATIDSNEFFDEIEEYNNRYSENFDSRSSPLSNLVIKEMRSEDKDFFVTVGTNEGECKNRNSCNDVTLTVFTKDESGGVDRTLDSSSFNLQAVDREVEISLSSFNFHYGDEETIFVRINKNDASIDDNEGQYAFSYHPKKDLEIVDMRISEDESALEFVIRNNGTQRTQIDYIVVDIEGAAASQVSSARYQTLDPFEERIFNHPLTSFYVPYQIEAHSISARIKSSNWSDQVGGNNTLTKDVAIPYLDFEVVDLTFEDEKIVVYVKNNGTHSGVEVSTIMEVRRHNFGSINYRITSIGRGEPVRIEMDENQMERLGLNGHYGNFNFTVKINANKDIREPDYDNNNFEKQIDFPYPEHNLVIEELGISYVTTSIYFQPKVVAEGESCINPEICDSARLIVYTKNEDGSVKTSKTWNSGIYTTGSSFYTNAQELELEPYVSTEVFFKIVADDANQEDNEVSTIISFNFARDLSINDFSYDKGKEEFTVIVENKGREEVRIERMYITPRIGNNQRTTRVLHGTNDPFEPGEIREIKFGLGWIDYVMGAEDSTVSISIGLPDSDGNTINNSKTITADLPHNDFELTDFYVDGHEIVALVQNNGDSLKAGRHITVKVKSPTSYEYASIFEFAEGESKEVRFSSDQFLRIVGEDSVVRTISVSINPLMEGQTSGPEDDYRIFEESTYLNNKIEKNLTTPDFRPDVRIVNAEANGEILAVTLENIGVVPWRTISRLLITSEDGVAITVNDFTFIMPNEQGVITVNMSELNARENIDYNFTFTADFENTAEELNEENNSLTKTVRFTDIPKPDLVVENIEIRDFELGISYKNLDSTNSLSHFRLFNLIVRAGDFERTFEDLSIPRENITGKIKILIPELDILRGQNVDFEVVIDSADSIGESNEDNNTTIVNLDIPEVGLPDLIISQHFLQTSYSGLTYLLVENIGSEYFEMNSSTQMPILISGKDNVFNLNFGSNKEVLIPGKKWLFHVQSQFFYSSSQEEKTEQAYMVVLDPNEVIVESNDENNTHSLTYYKSPSEGVQVNDENCPRNFIFTQVRAINEIKKVELAFSYESVCDAKGLNTEIRLHRANGKVKQLWINSNRIFENGQHYTLYVDYKDFISEFKNHGRSQGYQVESITPNLNFNVRDEYNEFDNILDYTELNDTLREYAIEKQIIVQ